MAIIPFQIKIVLNIFP
jgi:glycerol uptake facilitator-like aquaporin